MFGEYDILWLVALRNPCSAAACWTVIIFISLDDISAL